jgi:hypothetical protein
MAKTETIRRIPRRTIRGIRRSIFMGKRAQTTPIAQVRMGTAGWHGRGKEARSSYAADALMENRNGFLVDGDTRFFEEAPERIGCLEMPARKQKGRTKRITLGGDKWINEAKFVNACRKIKITPRAGVKEKAGAGLVEERTLQHIGYWISHTIRKRVEEIFG